MLVPAAVMRSCTLSRKTRSYLVDVLALKLRQKGIESVVVSLNANGTKNLLDVRGGRGGVAGEAEEEECCHVLHLDGVCLNISMPFIWQIIWLSREVSVLLTFGGLVWRTGESITFKRRAQTESSSSRGWSFVARVDRSLRCTVWACAAAKFRGRQELSKPVRASREVAGTAAHVPGVDLSRFRWLTQGCLTSAAYYSPQHPPLRHKSPFSFLSFLIIHTKNCDHLEPHATLRTKAPSPTANMPNVRHLRDSAYRREM